jgi:genome maintenance exonuclease 1
MKYWKKQLFIHKKTLPDEGLNRLDLPSGRIYERDGIHYHSVTTVISKMSDKSSLENWRKRVGEEEASKITLQATNRGTAVHNLCENYLLNKFLPASMPANMETFKSLKPYLDNHITEIYGIEHQMYSDTFGVAGTADVIGKWDNINSIIDFKTSRRFKEKKWIENYFIQSATYAYMCYERYNMIVPQIVILIAVDHERPQLFIEHPKNWLAKAKVLFDKHKSSIDKPLRLV